MIFLVRPRPQPGESLSSWRQRAGLVNGFRWFPTFNAKWLARDPDLLPNELEVDWLSREFNISQDEVRFTCLDQFADILAGGRFSAPLARWVLPCARQSSRHGATSGYCPICLREDEEPYFRLSWRLAFITHCPIHHCRLMERCPSCADIIWPNVFIERASRVPKWADLSLCQTCGHHLANCEPRFDGQQATSIDLWNTATTGIPPPHGPQGISADSYFAALWSLTRFIRRNTKALIGTLPSLPRDELGHPSLRNTVIERLQGDTRQTLLGAATWLLKEWPTRLVNICRTAGLSGRDFGCTEIENPEWFNEAIREHLFQRANWITREHVHAAIEELSATRTPISKNALRRKLGISESWAINELLDQRRSATAEELVTLCRWYYAQLVHTPPSRDQQRTLTRDFMMLMVSAFAGQSIETVCMMDEAGIEAVVRALRAEVATCSDPNRHFLVDCLIKLDDQYRNGIRPEFQFRGQDVPKTWFISRFGKMMDGHSVRSRITQIMKVNLDTRLWSSADTFRGTLFPAPG